MHRIAYIFGCMNIYRGQCMSLLFSLHQSCSCWFFPFSLIYAFPNIGNGWCITLIIGTLFIESNVFSDHFCELLCFFRHYFAGSHLLFHQQERMVGKGTRSNANERHTHLLTRTVWHRSLHGLIKINVAISWSTAVSVSLHMEPCTIYFNLLDFYYVHNCPEKWNYPFKHFGK